MATDGIEGVFLESHNWGASAKFFQELGFALELETDHASGLLRKGDGPYVFIAEVPEGQELNPPRVVVNVPAGFTPGSAVEEVSPFEATHWGTTEMTVRDPDGRLWNLQAPTAS